MKKYIKNFMLSIKYSFASSPLLFFLKVILDIINSLVAIGYVYLLSKIISIIEAGGDVQSDIVLYFCLFIFMFTTQKLLPHAQTYISEQYYDKTYAFLEALMIKKMKNIEQKCYEESAFKDKIRQLRSRFGSIFQISWTTIDLLTTLISITIVSLIIIHYSHIMLCLFILAVSITIVNATYFSRISEEREKITQLPSRRLSYYRGIFEDKIINCEIRTYNNNLFFLNKIEKERLWLFKTKCKLDRKMHSRDLISQIVALLIYAISIIVATNRYQCGTITIASITYYIGIVKNFQNYNSDFSIYANSFIRQNKSIAIVNDFLNDYAVYENTRGLKLNDPNPKIEFIDVWFKYPNSKDYVLRGCSFLINSKEKVLLIGKNGSGKSTILKLLFGLYKIQKGAILINEKRLEEYDVNSIRRNYGVLFQDSVMYSLPFREIVALSNFKYVNDDNLLGNVCAKSGIDKLVSTWERKFDTIIGAYYGDNGVYMSGGQWQLTSLARTYLSDSKYYALDEPSASLDVFSEDKIFKSFFNENEVNVVAISHFIANSLNADRIIVIENGMVIESGTHDELMKGDMIYKKWYFSQLKRYLK